MIVEDRRRTPSQNRPVVVRVRESRRGCEDRFRSAPLKSMAGVGKQMSSAGKRHDGESHCPVVAVGAISLKTAADFEQSMNMVKVATGARRRK